MRRAAGVRWLLSVVAAAIAIGGEGTIVRAQCAMCRTLLATPEGERIAAALRSGIWILLAAPFVTFAVIATAAVRSRKRLDTVKPSNLTSEGAQSVT